MGSTLITVKINYFENTRLWLLNIFRAPTYRIGLIFKIVASTS